MYNNKVIIIIITHTYIYIYTYVSSCLFHKCACDLNLQFTDCLSPASLVAEVVGHVWRSRQASAYFEIVLGFVVPITSGILGFYGFGNIFLTVT